MDNWSTYRHGGSQSLISSSHIWLSSCIMIRDKGVWVERHKLTLPYLSIIILLVYNKYLHQYEYQHRDGFKDNISQTSLWLFFMYLYICMYRWMDGWMYVLFIAVISCCSYWEAPSLQFGSSSATRPWSAVASWSGSAQWTHAPHSYAYAHTLRTTPPEQPVPLFQHHMNVGVAAGSTLGLLR